jgi:hypothetical protein
MGTTEKKLKLSTKKEIINKKCDTAIADLVQLESTSPSPRCSRVLTPDLLHHVSSLLSSIYHMAAQRWSDFFTMLDGNKNGTIEKGDAATAAKV